MNQDPKQSVLKYYTTLCLLMLLSPIILLAGIVSRNGNKLIDSDLPQKTRQNCGA